MQGEVTPGSFWHLLHEIKFDLDRVFMVREFKTLGNPGYVRIHNNARDVECSAQYHVGGFAAHTREFHQGLQFTRYLAMVSFNEGGGTILNTLGLVAIKPGGAYEFLYQGPGGFCKGPGCGQLCKECPGDLVYLLVRALGR